jgi:hypothetical protein
MSATAVRHFFFTDILISHEGGTEACLPPDPLERLANQRNALDDCGAKTRISNFVAKEVAEQRRPLACEVGLT